MARFRIMRKFTPFENFPLYGIHLPPLVSYLMHAADGAYNWEVGIYMAKFKSEMLQ